MVAGAVTSAHLDLVTRLEASSVMSLHWKPLSPVLCSDRPDRGWIGRGAMTLNRDQLLKLLNLTGSEYDAEALNAIRRANGLLRKHQATWADLFAIPQEPVRARQPEPPPQAQQQRARSRPRPRGSDAFRAKVRYAEWHDRATSATGQWHGYRANNATEQVRSRRIGSLSPSLSVLFFPYAAYVWLYKRVVLPRRRRLKPVAMLVPIFGGAAAALIWAFLVLVGAQLMGIV
jgi:hypothetical protein